MSTTGVKGKVKEIVLGMQALREHNTNPQNVNLRAHLAKHFGGMSTGKFYHELEVNPHATTVQELMADGDKAFLMAEIMRDGMLQGMGIAQREQDGGDPSGAHGRDHHGQSRAGLTVTHSERRRCELADARSLFRPRHARRSAVRFLPRSDHARSDGSAADRDRAEA